MTAKIDTNVGIEKKWCCTLIGRHDWLQNRSSGGETSVYRQTASKRQQQHVDWSILAYVIFQTFRLTPNIAFKLPRLFLDLVVQPLLHMSHSVWVLNNTRHSAYTPKDVFLMSEPAAGLGRGMACIMRHEVEVTQSNGTRISSSCLMMHAMPLPYYCEIVEKIYITATT